MLKHLRSRKQRRIKVKTPSGVKVVYKKRKPGLAHCNVCKAILHGIPRERPYKLRRLPKSGRRPERPYGGMLCHKCLKNKLVEVARKNV